MGKNTIAAKEKQRLKHKKSCHQCTPKSSGFAAFCFDGAKSVQIFRSAIIAFSILIAAGSFYLAHEATYYNKEAELIRHEKEEKITWMRQIDTAILNMRKLRYDIVRECTYGTPMPLKEQEALRMAAMFEFMKAHVGARFIFSEEMQNKARELVQFDYSVKDICATDAPSDSAWKQLMLEMDDIMGKSLQEDNKRLLHADQKVSEIEEIPFWQFLWPY